MYEHRLSREIYVIIQSSCIPSVMYRTQQILLLLAFESVFRKAPAFGGEDPAGAKYPDMLLLDASFLLPVYVKMLLKLRWLSKSRKNDRRMGFRIS